MEWEIFVAKYYSFQYLLNLVQQMDEKTDIIGTSLYLCIYIGMLPLRDQSTLVLGE